MALQVYYMGKWQPTNRLIIVLLIIKIRLMKNTCITLYKNN